MNWGIVVGIVFAALLLGLIFLLRGGFIILLGILMLLGFFGFILYIIYKWIFAPGWDK